MEKKINFLKVLLPLGVAFALFYQYGCCDGTSNKSLIPPQDIVTKSNNHFPDFGVMVSYDSFSTLYPGKKVFSLRQDYPAMMPPADSIPAFITNRKVRFDDTATWKAWMMELRDYCFAGMIDVDFVPQLNKTRDWYHVPWLHFGDSTNGYKSSEGFHGLAKEAPISPYQLTPNQTQGGQVYAIGFYNSFAGYILHEMWKNPMYPNAYATQGPKGGFPHGTVIFKLLFTDLDSSQVDYLKHPFEWTAFITPNWKANNRVVEKVHLIQMDFMVRDTAADKYGTGWVFGTFCYNGKLDNGSMDMKDRVKNLVPVGIQFGNDPSDTTNVINSYPFTKTQISKTLKQSFINTSDSLPPQHLGWGYRLDGPVDLNTASCMSCHATAEFPQISNLVPVECFIGDTNKYGSMTYLTATNSPDFRKYFQNTRCATAYDSAQAISTDFSLQVDLSLTYFWQWKNAMIGGYYASEFNRPHHKVNRSGEQAKKDAMMRMKMQGKK